MDTYIIDDWADFKALVAEIVASTRGYSYYKVGETDTHIKLVVVNKLKFSFDVKKGTADETDYNTNVNATDKWLIGSA